MISKSWFCALLAAAVVVCGCDETAKKPKAEKEKTIPTSNIVKLETSKGDIVIELNRQAAPVTVENFLGYVETGFYDGTIFHRVIPGFMIQGGGFTKQMAEKRTREPIINEAANGLSNKRGTISMARTNDPNSATCQFFINHTDNTPLDSVGGGYAVFGKVTKGMDVVDAIASVKTKSITIKKRTPNGIVDVPMKNVPTQPVIIESASVVP